MPDRVKNSLRFAFFAGIGSLIGCAIMRTFQEPVEYLRFFIIEFPVAFVSHLLVTRLSELLKSKKD